MIRLENVGMNIEGHSVLESISFEVLPGEAVGIVGINGSGKTSLLNCISGFQRLSGGEIRLRDRRVDQLAPHLRARLGLGRVFQNNGLFFELTVRENLILALESSQSFWANFLPWGESSLKNRRDANEILSRTGLSEHADYSASQLSGGEQRLLEIERTIASGADVILLDEATAGVSPTVKQQIKGQIEKLKHDNKTLLIVEHDLGFIAETCTRIILLHQGEIVMDDDSKQVLNSPLLRQIYLGNPADLISSPT